MRKFLLAGWVACLPLLSPLPALANEGACGEAVGALQPDTVFGASAPCASSQPAFCATLQQLPRDRFETLSTLFDAAPDSHYAQQMREALKACKLDFAALQYNQCQAAYRREELGYILRSCPNEAWSLARTQCERNLETISPRYYELCRRFGRNVPR